MQALSHPDEIWGVSPSPSDPSLLTTCSNSAKAGPSAGGTGFKVDSSSYDRLAGFFFCDRFAELSALSPGGGSRGHALFRDLPGRMIDETSDSATQRLLFRYTKTFKEHL